MQYKQVMVVQNDDDEKFLRSTYTASTYDVIVQNKESSIRKLDNVMVHEVYYTPEVMMSGMDRDLFMFLYTTFTSKQWGPQTRFKLLY